MSSVGTDGLEAESHRDVRQVLRDRITHTGFVEKKNKNIIYSLLAES